MTKPIQASEVRVDVSVAAPMERAFAVFTEQYQAWWPRTWRLGQTEIVEVVIEPRVGGRWYERTTDGNECGWGRVLEFDAPNHIALGWQITPSFSPEPDEKRASRVDVHFVASDPAHTSVTLVHSDFERHGENWEATRQAVANAWPGIMNEYAKVVAG